MSDVQRVVIVARSRLFRDGIQRVLESPKRCVIGHFGGVDDIGKFLEQTQLPTLIVVSIDRPDYAPIFEKVRELRAQAPWSRWIVLSDLSDAAFGREAIDAGVDALLQEDAAGEVLQLMADLVSAGHPMVPLSLARMLVDRQQEPPERAVSDAPEPVRPSISVNTGPLLPSVAAAPPPAASWAPPHASSWSAPRVNSLSRREEEILRRLAEGHSNKAIARELNIAETTVKVHVKSLLRKMQVTNRTQAAIVAINYLEKAPAGTNVIDLPPRRSPDSVNPMLPSATLRPRTVAARE